MPKHIREYWVRLYARENDSYNELWESKEGEFFIRHTAYPGGIWSTVSDPLGYCERDTDCRANILFHVCDSRFQELFLSSNLPDQGFPCLRELIHEEWEKWAAGNPQITQENETVILFLHSITGNSPSLVDNWLLTFKDPDLYGSAAKECDENWCMMTDNIHEEKLSSFQYAGDIHYITRRRERHRVCGVEWDEYHCSDRFMGCCFDKEREGSMYSHKSAINLVMKALRQTYPDSRCLSLVTVRDGQAYEQKYNIRQAAEHLLQGRCRKSFVDQMIQENREKQSFFTSRKAIRAQYPDCIPDWSLKYL